MISVMRAVVWGRLDHFQVLLVPSTHEDHKAVFSRTLSFTTRAMHPSSSTFE